MRNMVVVLSVLVAFVLAGGLYLATGQAQDKEQPQVAEKGPQEADVDITIPQSPGNPGAPPSSPLDDCSTPCITTSCGDECCLQTPLDDGVDMGWACCDEGSGTLQCGPEGTVWRYTDKCGLGPMCGAPEDCPVRTQVCYRCNYWLLLK